MDSSTNAEAGSLRGGAGNEPSIYQTDAHIQTISAQPNPSVQALPKVGRKRGWLVPMLVTLVLLGGGGIYTVRRSLPSQSPTATSTVLVETKDLTIRVDASGSIVSISSVNISPTSSGRLVALYVDQGDRVKAGQIVARMDTGDLTARLAKAQAQLAQAQAEYAEVRNGSRREEISRTRAQVDSAQAQVDLAAVQVERYRQLASQGAVAQSELDQKVSEDRSARASLREAQQQLQELLSGSRPEAIAQSSESVAAAQAEVALYQQQLDDTVLRAPFDGIITQRYATVGAIVTPTTSASSTASATSTSIVAIASGLEATLNVSESVISHIQPGQQVEIVADAYPNRTFAGRVKNIAPEAITENNVTFFEVTIALSPGQSDLRSGMTVDATFVGATIPAAVVVPTVAIATRDNQMGVMVADEAGNARFQPVQVGISQDGQTQIVNGLRAGERVFIDSPENPEFGAHGRGQMP
ncbi:MAG TPA: efflux RND transporter periplasmic adaptor subunit [Chroococcidiopsis sp.]